MEKNCAVRQMFVKKSNKNINRTSNLFICEETERQRASGWAEIKARVEWANKIYTVHKWYYGQMKKKKKEKEPTSFMMIDTM